MVLHQVLRLAETEMAVTEQPTVGPLRVGGNPVFVAAHGIKDKAGLSFDDSYALARLVLAEGGGPVSSRGRNAFLKKPTEDALMGKELIEVEADAEYTQRYYLQLSVDGRISELLDAKFSGVKITPKRVTERIRWAAVATQKAFDIVAECLPQ
jgi:hypothetical protein